MLPIVCIQKNFTIPAPGDISVVSQSGTLATIITLGGSTEGIRFSKYISSGNEADLHSGDFIEYFAQDPKTKVVIALIEGFKDGKKFMNASREVTKRINRSLP
ncbi:MAG: hypothetical protein SWO11_18630 [Thermodesulfobacteriota bacterium]|nr:hypothetical protein [Thermodesulfobacteriota bacterium]